MPQYARSVTAPTRNIPRRIPLGRRPDRTAPPLPLGLARPARRTRSGSPPALPPFARARLAARGIHRRRDPAGPVPDGCAPRARRVRPRPVCVRSSRRARRRGPDRAPPIAHRPPQRRALGGPLPALDGRGPLLGAALPRLRQARPHGVVRSDGGIRIPDQAGSPLLPLRHPNRGARDGRQGAAVPPALRPPSPVPARSNRRPRPALPGLPVAAHGEPTPRGQGDDELHDRRAPEPWYEHE